MQIYKIVLTGGPCAGKTTILNAVNKYLKQENIPYVTIPETATELIVNGIRPNTMSAYDFQDIVIKRQLMKEQDAEEYFKNHFANHDKCVIIYDRGIFDNAAYMDANEFEKLLSKYKLTSMSQIDKYDLVLDLLSVAVCKKEAYNLDNEARTETVSEAEILDTKTSNAWANHHNIKLLSSKVSIEEETKKVIDYLNNAINEIENQERVKYPINILKSNLGIYNNLPRINVTENHFDVGLPKEYHFVVSVRNTHGASYILEIYREIDNKVLTIYNKTLDYNTFDYIRTNYKLLKILDKKEINFIKNQTFYRLNQYGEKFYIEIQNNTVNNEYTLPEGVNVYHNSKFKIETPSEARLYVKELILKK